VINSLSSVAYHLENCCSILHPTVQIFYGHLSDASAQKCFIIEVWWYDALYLNFNLWIQVFFFFWVMQKVHSGDFLK